MRIGVVTLFPGLVLAVTGCGITARAVQRGLLAVQTWNPRDHADNRHRSVDDDPYGGGPGMVMTCQPLRAAIEAARSGTGSDAPVIYLSPQGERFDQRRAKQLAAGPGAVLVAGRYEGVDERVIETCVDEELSIGDYVLSGGELAAMVVIDALTRLLPGALGDDQSAIDESFVDGLLDYQHYTRPETVDGQRVPAVLLSGDHAAVARWRRKQALGRTWQRRPDLLAGRALSPVDRLLLDEYATELAERGRRAPISGAPGGGLEDEQAD